MVFNLKIVTPHGTFYNGKAVRLNIVTLSGSLGVMAGHIPLVGVIPISHLSIVEEDKTIKAAIQGGVLYVNKEETLVIADSIEDSDNIDIVRAKAAEERARNLLLAKHEDVDIARAHLALERALNRLKLGK